MNIFETVKQSVTTRQAAEHYGIKVGRNGITCCPFHKDRTLSMKVDKRYYCFGCGATGNVIDFVAAEAMEIYRSGDFKLAFSKEVEMELDKYRLEFMAEDTEAGVIQAWLNEHEDKRVCSLMIFKEALDNPYVKPKKSDTDRICEIMNTSVVGWFTGNIPLNGSYFNLMEV